MAYVDKIWLHGVSKSDSKMRVYAKLRPAGDLSIDVPIPETFMKCILDMAQSAIDLKESQMKAEILADKDNR